MKSSMILEIEEGLNIDDIELCLSNLNARIQEKKIDELKVYLPNSKTTMTATTNIEHREILAENIDIANWNVGLRIYFDINPSEESPCVDIKNIIIQISKMYKQSFVLSYQYETIYAQKNKKKLVLNEYLNKMT